MVIYIEFLPISSFLGHFFFPLLRPDAFNSSRRRVLDFDSEDSYLLGRLIYSLGIILQAASHTTYSLKMSRELMEFLWKHKYHSDA